MILVGTLILKMLSNNVIHFYNYYLDLKSLSFQKRKRFYNAYILAYFDLCCVIWGNCTSIMEDKLVKLQKRAARAILDVDFTVPLRNHVYST